MSPGYSFLLFLFFSFFCCYYQGLQSRVLTYIISFHIQHFTHRDFFNVSCYRLAWLVWWYKLRITRKPYMCQIFKLISFRTLKVLLFSFSRPVVSSVPCWFSLNWTRSLTAIATDFFPVASRLCAPVFTGFIFAVLTLPTEELCSLSLCSAGSFHWWPWGNVLPLCL